MAIRAAEERVSAEMFLDRLQMAEIRVAHNYFFLNTKIGSCLCLPCFCFAPGIALNSNCNVSTYAKPLRFAKRPPMSLCSC